MAQKRKRFNWKARQSKRSNNQSSLKSTSTGLEHLLAKSEQTDDSYSLGGIGGDSNAVVLPSKVRKLDIDDDKQCERHRRKKLSDKQRKKLRKIIEVKQKKERHSAVIQSLQKLALPQSEMCLLQPASSISRKRMTGCEAVRYITELKKASLPVSASASLYGTSWRKKGCRKNYRKLKVEKVLFSPKEEDECEFSESDDTLEESEEEIEDTSKQDKHLVNNQETNPSLVCHTYVESMPSAGSPEQVKVNNLPKLASPTHPPKKSVYVHVDRSTHIQEGRLSLPVLSHEQEIMEAISEEDVVIICGETGSGKTTQVPQFLYEAGYTQRTKSQQCLIGVTEPRRVAAVTMSKRVAEELNMSEKEVSYQIRYEANLTNETVLKFMTDGILLKEVEKDFMLLQYSVIIIDEAHERSVFTDVLIGLLSRIVPLRKKKGQPLKLVIMSATLRVEDFTENRLLFPSPPPVVKVDSRQYPVTIHFNKRTPSDYVLASFSKVSKIHRSLPDGHILVFLTGRAEVHSLCSKLRKKFPIKCHGKSCHEATGKEEQCSSDTSFKTKPKEYSVDLDDYPMVPNEEEEEEDEMEYDSDFENDEGEQDSIASVDDSEHPLMVLPLYSMLPHEQQAKVFQPTPEGVRLCVVATNVAETSITIPNVKYVVDCGKAKFRLYDGVTSASIFRVNWISKASANQRAGRAGRTTPGHCYRLYSSAVFQHEFQQFSAPEIAQRPVDDLVLQMKALHINKVVNFPFPTSPSNEALMAAEKLLVQLGALTSSHEQKQGEHHVTSSTITPMGTTMSRFPISPRYSKMLCMANQHGCLPYVIAIVSALSVPEVFVINELETVSREEEVEDTDRSTDKEKGSTKQQLLKLANTKRTWAGKGEYQLLGDLMVLLRAVGAFECSSQKEVFCESNCLRMKAMLEIRKLRQQLTNIVNAISEDVSISLDPNMAPPTNEQVKFIRQIVLAGLGDHVARKIPIHNLNIEDKKRLRFAYESPLCEDPLFLHPSSVLLSSCPQYVVYQELLGTNKQYIRGISAVEEDWFPIIQPQLCAFSSPLDFPPPSYDTLSGTIRCHKKCSYNGWPMSNIETDYPNCLDKYKLFAQYLLQGKVVPSLSKYCPYLLSAPVTMMKTWAKLHKRTEVLLSALVAKEVYTREKLLQIWIEDSKYLLKAYSMWIPESKHSQLALHWPPCYHKN